MLFNCLERRYFVMRTKGTNSLEDAKTELRCCKIPMHPGEHLFGTEQSHSRWH